MPENASSGPLAGTRVVELAGIGPAPFCVMLLADMGADVVRIDRVGPPNLEYPVNPVVERGRRSVAVDLKSPAGRADRPRPGARQPTCWSRATDPA